MCGPRHGCVFNVEGTDEYYFAYLEFGRRSTNRQIYVNRLEFNEDGTIRQVKPGMKGNKKIKIDTIYASSNAQPLDIKSMKDSLFKRTEYFVSEFAIDGANGSR